MARTESSTAIPELPAQPASKKLVQALRDRRSPLWEERRLPGALLEGADLSTIDLTGWDLTGARLDGANLTDANLSRCRLDGASLRRANLTRCELLAADLTSADLSESHAQRAGFGGANLTDANLCHANGTEASFSQATLRRSDLRSANLQGARFRAADVRQANFNGSDLREAELREARVDGAHFRSADLRGAALREAQGFERADWVGVDIRGLDLRGAYRVQRFIRDQNFLHEFRSHSRWRQLVYFVWWITSDCGRSMLRWIGCVVGAALAFTAAYCFVDVDYGSHPTALSPFYFSVVTLTTLGYGDVVPASIPAQILTILEVIMGYLSLGGLLAIMANKMARRAD